MKYLNTISAKLICFFCFVALLGNAQTTTNSPYSRYGIGELQSTGFVKNLSMGGTGVAVMNDSIAPYYVNVLNPASYATNRITTFEAGLNSQFLTISSSSAKAKLNSVAPAYLAFGLPFTKWWGASFGLMPYSQVGYNLSLDSTYDNIGDVTSTYKGSGGINKAYFGSGLKINKYLSLGGNFSYLFGSISNERKISISGGNFHNTRIVKSTSVSDFNFDYGINSGFSIDSLKGKALNEKVKINFGATASLSKDINAKSDILAATYISQTSYYDSDLDTLQFDEDVKGKINLPLALSFGLSFKKGERILVAADYAMQQWSQSSYYGENLGLKNSMRTSVGIQYNPASSGFSKSNYFKRIQYRAGIKYASSFIQVNNTQLTETSVSIGFGLPVGRLRLYQQFSMFNFGFEIGKRGTTDNGLIKENFVKAVIGITINDRWFIKPKFD